MTNDATALDAPPPADRRLLSLDALRGFDMFWIIGGEDIAQAAAQLTKWGWLVWLSGQLSHPEWHGFAFYDLIFPLFLFMAGVAMPFSFEKRQARGDTRAQLYRHVLFRGLLLVLLGMIFNGLLKFDWETMRYPSVLGRIGLAYLFAALIFLNTRLRGRLVWIVLLLAAYWAALRFIPVPEFGAHDLRPGHTLTDFIDQNLIPGRLHRGDRDPEGLLATVPAIATALLGAVTGSLLKTERLGRYAKTLIMLATGGVFLGLAYLWNFEFPINKNLWTSSFVLHCAGWSLLFLALFYLLIDVWRLRSWAFPLIVIGSNAIFIYMARRFIDFQYTSDFFFGGALRHTGAYQPLLEATCILLVEWLLLLFLYKKRVFLKV